MDPTLCTRRWNTIQQPRRQQHAGKTIIVQSIILHYALKEDCAGQTDDVVVVVNLQQSWQVKQLE